MSGQEDLIFSNRFSFRISHLNIYLLPLFLILSACNDKVRTQNGNGDNSGPQNSRFSDPSSSCASSVLEKQFIVHWKNGDISIVNAEDRQEFFDKVLLENEDDIIMAEHDYLIQLDHPTTFAETSAVVEPVNWGFDKIKAEDIWNEGQKGNGVVVAVIDTGADIAHAQIQNQLFFNPNEIAGNDIDDDGNGLVDDVSGWDFFNDTPLTDDPDGHGTHVSGIILADDSAGTVKGVAPEAKLLPLNFMNNGAGTLGAAVKAIDYAVQMGAKVINASWGGSSCSTILETAISGLDNLNVLFVNASGNNGSNLDSIPEFPANYVFNHQITVGSSTINDFTSAFSNFSREVVELVAPGTSIISTISSLDDDGLSQGKCDGETTCHKSGTSMSTPFVSGAAALLWGAFPSATAAQIKEALMKVDTGPFPVKFEGRLNVKKGYDHLKSIFP